MHEAVGHTIAKTTDETIKKLHVLYDNFFIVQTACGVTELSVGQGHFTGIIQLKLSKRCGCFKCTGIDV